MKKFSRDAEELTFDLLRFFEGDGTEVNPYEIDSADDLKRLARDVNDGNSYADKFFVLTADIELIGEWTPIGYFIDWNDEKSFSGTFDGDGHTIGNLRINSSGDYVGLFGCVDGIVKNVNLTNVSVSGNGYTGGLVGCNHHGKIENCTLSYATVNGNYSVGGLVGCNWKTVTNCTVSNVIVNSDGHVGGLIGYNWERVTNCTVSNATVRGNENVGGLAGVDYRGTNENCTVSDSTVSGGDNVGGIVGETRDESFNKVKNCTVIGTTVKGANHVGGVVGFDGKRLAGVRYYGTVENCTVSDTTVNGNYSVGGIIGYSMGTTVKNCTVKASVSGEFSVGGLGGHCDGGYVKNCTVNVKVRGNSDDVGGLLGYSTFIVEKCTVQGTVSGKLSVGGLIGMNKGVLDFKNGTVTDCKVNAEVSGNDSVGGMVGLSWGIIKNCTVSNAIIGGKRYVGGLVGKNGDERLGNGVIENCTVNNAKVNGYFFVGGLVGKNGDELFHGSKIENCSVDVTVNGNDSVGGLVGWLDTRGKIDGTNYFHCNKPEAVGKIDGKIKGTMTRVYLVKLPESVIVDGAIEICGKTFFASGTTLTVNNFTGEEIIFDDAVAKFERNGDKLIVRGDNVTLTISGLPSSVVPKLDLTS